jgi:hypothetical protein
VADDFDFDPERFRDPKLEAAVAAVKAEIGTRQASNHKGNKKRPKQADLFVQILQRAVVAGAQAVRERRLVVWLYIHYRVWCENSNTVEVGNKNLREWGVSHQTKTRALLAFERAGLVTIEWRGRNSPWVTVRADMSMLCIK